MTPKNSASHKTNFGKSFLEVRDDNHSLGVGHQHLDYGCDTKRMRLPSETDKLESITVDWAHQAGGKAFSASSPTPFPGNAECIVPRSKAEADILNGGNKSSKHRQLPCRTYISTGFCPYKDRCVYLHDPRVQSTIKVSNSC